MGLDSHAGRGIFQVPTADNYIRQGVTTVMEGVDGGGSSIAGGTPVPLKPFLDRVEALPKSINFATFIGQGVVREAVLGLADRGLLRAGMKADIAVFDPSLVRDTATYEKPHQYAEGFKLVIVNGAVVFENGAMTAARPGRVLYGPGR